jgi:Sulfotransferase domain
MNAVLSATKRHMPRSALGTIYHLALRYKVLTHQAETIPDFVVIGAMKSGTTALYDYLTTHPNVAPALRKEIYFFDRYFGQGLSWYKAHFPSPLYKLWATKVCGKYPLRTGEASTTYIFHPLAPKRILDSLPQVKLVALLRNPIDRAYSHYYHLIRTGKESLSFAEAVEREPERIEIDKAAKLNEFGCWNPAFSRYSYVSRGLYADQLENWLKYFSREQLLIIKSEDMFANPPQVFLQTCKFLDLPTLDLMHYGKLGAGNYSEMDSKTKRWLADYFKPHNQKLYDLLETNFNWD